MTTSTTARTAPVTTDPYDRTEAVQLLITDRAKRYTQDFVEAREVAALALRDAVMKSAQEAGYFVAQANGHHEIAPREASSAVVALLANADGVRVARLENARLSDETAADLHYDASLKAWVTGAAKKDASAAKKATEPSETDGGAAPKVEAPRSPVAVVAELVVAALQKIT